MTHQKQLDIETATETGSGMATGFIAVISDAVHFSPPLARSVTEEFRLDVAVLPSPEALLDRRAQGWGTPHLLIVDESHADDLVARRAAYLEAAGSASVILAYRDADRARVVLQRWIGQPGRALGYLPMGLPLDVWLSTLRLLLNMHVHVPLELLEQAGAPAVADGANGNGRADRPEPATAPLHDLTRREREVLGMLTTGRSNKQIAAELAITEHTVKLHVHNAVRKMGVRNRTAAAMAWVRATEGARPG